MAVEELDATFKLLHDYFHSDWLNKAGSHPIQVLWKRRDALSTIELYLLASSLRNLEQLNSAWVRRQVKEATGKDENNRRGAIFELVGLNYLHKPVGYPELRLAPANQPGFDASLRFENGKHLYLSLKNFGPSQHYRTFKQRSQSIEQQVQRYAARHGLMNIRVVALCDEHAGDGHWDALRQALPDCINSYASFKKPLVFAVKSGWMVSVSDVNYDEELDARRLSYTIHIGARQHPNDKKNLLGKLETARANLAKHAPKAPDDQNCAVYVHVNQWASFAACTEWAEEYFTESPNDPIGSIILYQPAVTTDQSDGTTALTHTFDVRSRPGFTLPGRAEFDIPVGLISSSPSSLELHIGEQKVELTNHYFYQRGEITAKARTIGNTSEGEVKKLAQGILLNLSVDNMIFGGHFPPEDEVLIL